MLVIVFATTACGTQKEAAPESSKAPADANLILATTTSTQDSGLLDVLIPAFEKKTGYKVKTIAVGTGKALAMGEKGEADVLLVHAPSAEKKVMESGSTINRQLVMHNDFIVVGVANDPAQIKGKTTDDAFKAIAAKQALFVSRGDDSGTDKMEKQIWKDIKVAADGPWYLSAGAGMGQTLKIANEKNGYTLTDRATYLAQKKNLSLDILVEGDKKLLNIYHVMEVNPEKFNKVNKDGAKAFSEFLLAKETQAMIAEFGKDEYGQALFFADGDKTDADLGL